MEPFVYDGKYGSGRFAIADWLDAFEARAEEEDFTAADWNEALAVARRFLGEVSDA